MSICVERQQSDANTEMPQILGLSNKDVKAAIKKTLQEVMSNTIKMNGKR